MGKQSEGNSDEIKRLYTIILKGGTPFEMMIPFSGVVSHDGVHSLHHVYCTASQLDEVLSMGSTQATVHYESENEEQKAERKLLHRQDLEKIFPTAECGQCFWFDLSTKNLCGAKDWADEQKKASLELHKKALEDIHRCPFMRGQVG